MDGSQKSLKLVCIGDGSIGKTCLLLRFLKDEFPQGDAVLPTVLDNDSKQVVFQKNEEDEVQITNLYVCRG